MSAVDKFFEKSPMVFDPIQPVSYDEYGNPSGRGILKNNELYLITHNSFHADNKPNQTNNEMAYNNTHQQLIYQKQTTINGTKEQKFCNI